MATAIATADVITAAAAAGGADALLMQVLEVETFIPMVLQRQEDGVARLKRVILIGKYYSMLVHTVIACLYCYSWRIC
jgi:hypothetical protein